MREKIEITKQSIKAEGILSTLNESPLSVLLFLGATAIVLLLILRCRSNSTQSIKNTTVTGSKVLQDAGSSFWANTEHTIDGAKISSGSNVVQRNPKK